MAQRFAGVLPDRCHDDQCALGVGKLGLTNLNALQFRVRALPMVRVPATQYHFIARALDLGAMGVMVPMVVLLSIPELLKMGL